MEDNDKQSRRSGKNAEGSSSNNSPRARNKTVMLAPDVVGKTRAQIEEHLQHGFAGKAYTPEALPESTRPASKPKKSQSAPSRPPEVEDEPAVNARESIEARPEPSPNTLSGDYVITDKGLEQRSGGIIGRQQVEHDQPTIAPGELKRSDLMREEHEISSVAGEAYDTDDYSSGVNGLDDSDYGAAPVSSDAYESQEVQSHTPESYTQTNISSKEQGSISMEQHRVAPHLQAVPQGGDCIVWRKQSPIVGFLVSYDKNPNGEVFHLQAGRLIVTSGDVGTGDYLFIEHGSVSPMHAILRINKEGEMQVLDQLSENGTFIYRFDSEDEERLSGDKSVVEHGDVLQFGDRVFYVCVVARDVEEV